jgi:hypothetical protein
MTKVYKYHHKDQFDINKVFRGIKNNYLLEETLERIRKFLLDKYHIDYVEVNIIDEKSEYLMLNNGNDKWHEYLWGESQLIYTWYEMSRSCKLATLENKQMAIELCDVCEKVLPEYMGLRASIVGELKTAFGVMLHNDRGNKIQFCMTFKNGQGSVGSMNYTTYICLLKDLKSFQNILDPFMDEFKNASKLNDLGII